MLAVVALPRLKIDHKTVSNHLHKAGFKKTLDVWVSHELTQKNMMDRISICEALVKRNEIEPFLKRMLAIDQKRLELANRRGVVFHHDNARPHTSIVTHQKLRQLGWEVLMHPPYSPNLAPSDYHLFLSLQNFFGDKKLSSREDCENLLAKFLPIGIRASMREASWNYL
ncbi:histone-lysine N-methyltransferase SETMAR-like [Monomorium pharaonis]|uniref:histone-lysine N-methyltransferase SETMAR-like n=1 Tax=Monomorium pharaonis TaxID=307658 RepID=UPI00063FAD7C|nr:histone-lysine N-methyltransferase SETMAR-like [Monomorium pharaonis]